MRRRDFLAGLPVAAVSAQVRQPNILLLFPDQWRFDWDGAHEGIHVRTPNLDALRKRGVSFTKAIVAAPVCAPSRACLAAGKEYERCRVASNGVDFPLDQTTYYQLLRNAGYQVAGCGKLDLHKKTEDWGLDGQRCLKEWGFTSGIDNEGKRDAVRSGAVTPKGPYMAYLHRRGLAQTHVDDFKKRKGASATFPTPLPEEAYCDNWLSNNGIELMRQFPKGRPWHLAVNFTGPHEPMDITRRMEERCRGVVFPQPHGNKQFNPATHVAIRQNYAAMIENIDRWIGIFLDEVGSRGELDNTLVAFSSDHGEMLGDHGRWGKSVPFQQSIGVPMVLAGPGVKSGVRTDALVSIMDLAATFLDFGGVAKPKDMDSLSLLPLLEGKTRKHREFARSGLGNWRAVWDGRYKLVRGFSEETELFDMESDPQEDHNIAARSKDMVERLSEVIV
jgi:arylsulfatase A-like enzyme